MFFSVMVRLDLYGDKRLGPYGLVSWDYYNSLNDKEQREIDGLAGMIAHYETKNIFDFYERSTKAYRRK